MSVRTYVRNYQTVVTIHRKDLDKFQGQSEGSTGWLNLDHELLKRKFSIPEPDFYKKIVNNIEVQDIRTYKTFVVTFDNTKVNLSMRIDTIKPNK